MRIWIAISLIAAITLLWRTSFIVLLSNWDMPAWLVRALKFVPVAVFPAILAPLLLNTNGQLDLSLSNLKIFAGLIAIIVSWRTKHLLGTIVAGMVALWVLQIMVGS